MPSAPLFACSLLEVLLVAEDTFCPVLFISDLLSIDALSLFAVLSDLLMSAEAEVLLALLVSLLSVGVDFLIFTRLDIRAFVDVGFL